MRARETTGRNVSCSDASQILECWVVSGLKLHGRIEDGLASQGGRGNGAKFGMTKKTPVWQAIVWFFVAGSISRLTRLLLEGWPQSMISRLGCQVELLLSRSASPGDPRLSLADCCPRLQLASYPSIHPTSMQIAHAPDDHVTIAAEQPE